MVASTGLYLTTYLMFYGLASLRILAIRALDIGGSRKIFTELERENSPLLYRINNILSTSLFFNLHIFVTPFLVLNFWNAILLCVGTVGFIVILAFLQKAVLSIDSSVFWASSLVYFTMCMIAILNVAITLKLYFL